MSINILQKRVNLLNSLNLNNCKHFYSLVSVIEVIFLFIHFVYNKEFYVNKKICIRTFLLMIVIKSNFIRLITDI